ncbi:MAG: hypothetical protein LBM96_01860 [Methanobrevibacter sp.]|jgi:hypothetical protein|nr:hypothetical protein [Candidatus Methanoflexus mossambicus]
MDKNKKIIIGVIIAIVAIIAVVGIIMINQGPTAEMSGKTYHIGDKKVFESFNGKLKIDTYVTSINDEAMYSETKDGKYTVMWDLKKGLGTLVNYPDDMYNDL